MAVHLYNHLNSPGWVAVHKKISMKANGATTYSQNITKYYWPIFEQVFQNYKKDVAVITVTRESHPLRFPEKLIFCFRHECRFRQQPTIENCRAFAQANKHAKVIFVVWEEDCAMELHKNGLNAIFLPMAIDVKEIRSHLTPSTQFKNRVIYFGNVRNAKQQAFFHLKSCIQRHGWYLDRISDNRFNGGTKLSRDDVLKILQRYKYGVGVGICAHEMAALGLKTYIYAYGRLGHLPMSQKEGQRLLYRNLCSPESATVNPVKALQNFPSSVVIQPRDIHDNQSLLLQSLRQYL